MSELDKDTRRFVTFLRRLADYLEEYPHVARNLRKSRTIGLLPPLDPFKVYAEEGREKLEEKLSPLKLEQLKAILLEYGFDANGKVRKWKTKRRVVQHIVNSVESLMKKGDSFLFDDES